MRTTKLIESNQIKTKHILKLFFLLIPFLMQAQIDSVNIQGVYYCSRNLLDIIKEDKKVIAYVVPEDFISDSLDYKIDTAYVYLENRKYLQQTYTGAKLKFKTLTDDEKKSFYFENLVTKEKGKIDFTESCEIIFTGLKYYHEDKKYRFFFKAKFDGYEYELSLRFGKFGNRKGIILNSSTPQYKKCVP